VRSFFYSRVNLHIIPGNRGHAHLDNLFSPHCSRACNYKRGRHLRDAGPVPETGDREKTFRGAQPGFPGIITRWDMQEGISNAVSLIHDK